MKPPASFHQRGIIASAFLIFTTAVPLLRAADNSPIVAKVSDIAAVTVTDSGGAWTLDNGIVKAVINKRNGEMRSLVYKGVDTMGHDQGSSGYWEQDPSAAASINGLTDSITIDPAKNGGQRAEVSVKGVTGGKIQLSTGARRRHLLRHRNPLCPGTRRQRHLRLRNLHPSAAYRAGGRGTGKPLHHQDQPDV